MTRAVRSVGRFELATRLASGHSGEIHLAHLSSLYLYSREGASDQPFVVKLFKPELARMTGFRALMQREGHVAMRFDHRAALRIFDIGVADEVYVAMELVLGQSLASVLHRCALERRPLSSSVILWIALEVARVLRSAHQTPWAEGEDTPIVHAMLSPDSVMLTHEGDVKLMGVGLGRSRLVLPPSVTTMAYRAPELIERSGADRRADIYSLGLLLYDGLTGQRVFRRRTTEETQSAVLAHAVPSLAEVRPDLPPGLVELVHAMTAPRRNDRPKSIIEVEPLLEQALGDGADTAWDELRSAMALLFGNETRGLRRMVEAMMRSDAGAAQAGAAAPRPRQGSTSAGQDPARAGLVAPAQPRHPTGDERPFAATLGGPERSHGRRG